MGYSINFVVNISLSVNGRKVGAGSSGDLKYGWYDDNFIIQCGKLIKGCNEVIQCQ